MNKHTFLFISIFILFVGYMIDSKKPVSNRIVFPDEAKYAADWKTIDGHHLNAKDVKKLLKDACANNYNLLLNIGPLPDGSVHPEDITTLSNLKK